MKALYPQLAWNSICKNSRYYVPYIIAGAMMVMMFYIMNYLNASIYVASLLGGSAMQIVNPKRLSDKTQIPINKQNTTKTKHHKGIGSCSWGLPW